MKTPGLLLALLVVLGTAPAALAQSARALLSGYNEVIPAGGAVSTQARGSFLATIDEGAQTISYALSYEGFETPVTQAHIHFGQVRTTGGISAWLCGTTSNPGPSGTPVCPETAGTVEGTITPLQVVGPSSQGIAAGEFAELVRAIRVGATYANVHSTAFGSGEIRGPIRAQMSGSRDDD